jgi:hypothetical protein
MYTIIFFIILSIVALFLAWVFTIKAIRECAETPLKSRSIMKDIDTQIYPCTDALCKDACSDLFDLNVDIICEAPCCAKLNPDLCGTPFKKIGECSPCIPDSNPDWSNFITEEACNASRACTNYFKRSECEACHQDPRGVGGFDSANSCDASRTCQNYFIENECKACQKTTNLQAVGGWKTAAECDSLRICTQWTNDTNCICSIKNDGIGGYATQGACEEANCRYNIINTCTSAYCLPGAGGAYATKAECETGIYEQYNYETCPAFQYMNDDNMVLQARPGLSPTGATTFYCNIFNDPSNGDGRPSKWVYNINGDKMMRWLNPQHDGKFSSEMCLTKLGTQSGNRTNTAVLQTCSSGNNFQKFDMTEDRQIVNLASGNARLAASREEGLNFSGTTGSMSQPKSKRQWRIYTRVFDFCYRN